VTSGLWESACATKAGGDSMHSTYSACCGKQDWDDWARLATLLEFRGRGQAMGCHRLARLGGDDGFQCAWPRNSGRQTQTGTDSCASLWKATRCPTMWWVLGFRVI